VAGDALRLPHAQGCADAEPRAVRERRSEIPRAPRSVEFGIREQIVLYFMITVSARSVFHETSEDGRTCVHCEC
jgi:hypothetical protein